MPVTAGDSPAPLRGESSAAILRPTHPTNSTHDTTKDEPIAAPEQDRDPLRRRRERTHGVEDGGRDDAQGARREFVMRTSLHVAQGRPHARPR